MKKLIRVMFLSALLALAMGVTAMAADVVPSVKVNGEAVDFPDAVPQIVEGRTYIPLRAVFNALGFADDNVTWDGPTRTATAVKGGLTITLTEGQKNVTIVKDGQTETLETDAAAFIDAATGRTLVPLRFVAQAAGCSVGWDQEAKTAIIDDTAAILAANTETYELMDKYMAYNNSFSKEKYAVNGDYSMSMGIAGDYVDVSGTYDMLMDNMAAQFTTSMAFSGSVEGEDMAAALPNGLDLDMRFDMGKGTYYMYSKALNEMMDMGISGMWYKLDLAAMMDQFGAELPDGMDYSALLALEQSAAEMTFAQYVEYALGNLPLNDAAATTSDVLAVINSICGDSAFKKSGSNYTSTIEEDGVKLALTLYTSGNKVNGYAMELSAANLMNLSMSMRSNAMTMQMGMGGAGLTVNMQMNGKYTVTSKSPETEPPKGAGIIDLMDLMRAEG